MKNKIMTNFQRWLKYNDDESRPVTKEVYLQYYKEGCVAFLACLHPTKEDNPYVDGDGRKTGKLDNLCYKAYPWFDGYRDAAEKYFNEKYKINALQKKVRELVKEHGLILKYSDEYGDPYIMTKEGFCSKIC